MSPPLGRRWRLVSGEREDCSPRRVRFARSRSSGMASARLRCDRSLLEVWSDAATFSIQPRECGAGAGQRHRRAYRPARRPVPLPARGVRLAGKLHSLAGELEERPWGDWSRFAEHGAAVNEPPRPRVFVRTLRNVDSGSPELHGKQLLRRRLRRPPECAWGNFLSYGGAGRSEETGGEERVKGRLVGGRMRGRHRGAPFAGTTYGRQERKTETCSSSPGRRCRRCRTGATAAHAIQRCRDGALRRRRLHENGSDTQCTETSVSSCAAGPR